MKPCKPTIIRTVLRDGVRKSVGAKQTKKYSKAETINHDIIYDFLLSLAETSGQSKQKIRLNLAVNSDKATVEVTEITPIMFSENVEFFSQERFNLLVENYVDRRRQHAKRILENILQDYSTAFKKQFNSLDEIQEELEKNSSILNVQDVAKKFTDAGIPFYLDYHYVVGENKEGKKYPKLKQSIVEYVKTHYSPDEETQRNLNEKNKQKVIEDIIEQRNYIINQGVLNTDDFNIHYALAKLNYHKKTSLGRRVYGQMKKIRLNPFEKQNIRKKLNSSDQAVLETLKSMNVYDSKNNKILDTADVFDISVSLPSIIDEFLITWMNASEEYHTASTGSSLFYKGSNQQKQYIERGKRGALLSSTIHPYDVGNPFGIPRYGQLIVVEDPKQSFNTLVREMSLDIADGSSFSTELQQIQFKSSLGNQVGQPTGSHIKDLGVFKDKQRETATFKKDNNFLISHERIRKSVGNKLDFKVINDSLYRQSSLRGLFEGVTVPDITYKTKYKDETGKINEVSIRYLNKQEDGFPVFEVITNGKNPEEKVMRNLLDLYNTLGNAYTVNENNEYTKIGEKGHSPGVINEILALDVMLKTFAGKTHEQASELKSNMKLGFSFVSAIKSSQPNINSLESLTKGQDLMSVTVDQSHLGIQLNASKDTDDKEATLPSQIIGALGLTSYTPEFTRKAFDSLKEVIASAIDERFDVEGIDIDPQKKMKLYDAIRELSLEALSTTGTLGLANYILNKVNIPLDNPQVSKIVTAAINAYLSSEGIRRNIFGNQYVLAPPIQVYEDADSVFFGDEPERRVVKPMVNRLKESGIVDSIILSQPRTVFYKTITFQEGSTSFQLTGKEALKFQLDVKTPYLFKVKNQEQVEERLKAEKIPYKKINDAFSISFEIIEEMDEVLDILGEIVELDYDNTTARDLKPARVKYVLEQGGKLVVRDLYSTPESKLLRSGKQLTEEERNITLNKLDQTIQDWSKSAKYVMSLPGEIIAPKAWKSKFLLSDQESLSKIKGDDNYVGFFEEQINKNKKRQKLLDDLFLKEENGVPLYKVLGIVPETEANKETIEKIDETIKSIKTKREQIEENKKAIETQKKLLDTTDATRKRNTSLYISSLQKEIEEYERDIKNLENVARSLLTDYYAIKLAENFQEALKSVTTRIPLQSLASVMSQEIVGFLDTEENTAMVNNEHQGLTGGDFDVDKTTYMSKYVNDYGLIENRKNRKEYWINNLFEQIYKASIDPRNMIQRESGVDMSGVEEVVKNIKTYPFRENHYLSTVELKYANMVGKDVIGIAATMLKVYSSMNIAANKKLDEFSELYDKLKKQKPEERNAEEINRLNSLFSELHQEFTYYIKGKQKTVHFLSNLPPEKVIKLYEYMLAKLEPLNEQQKEVLKNYKEELDKQHKTADVLGQLLNAATDNAKHLYLGRMRIDTDTAGLVATMVIDGIPLAAAAEFLLDPELSEIFDQKDSNLFKNYTGLSLESVFREKYKQKYTLYKKLLNKSLNLQEELEELKTLGYDPSLSLEENIKIAKSEADKFYTLLNAASKSSELTALGQILGINQGLKPTSFGMHARLNSVNMFFNNKVRNKLSDIGRRLTYQLITEEEALEEVNGLINEGLIKPKETRKSSKFNIYDYDVVEFDFIRWIEDDSYREKQSKLYNKLKTAHNIFDTLQNLPHTLEQLKIFAKSYKILQATSPKFNTAISLSRQISDAGLLKRSLDEITFEKYVKAVNMFVQDSYFEKAAEGVHVVNLPAIDNAYPLELNFDLKNLESRKNFIKSFNEYMMTLKKLNPNNEFLKVLSLDNSQFNEHGQSIERLKVVFSRDVVSPTSFELAQELAIKADLKRLNPKILKALRYYNLIIYQDSNTRGSFTSYFTNPELFESYWDYESSITTEELKESFNFDTRPETVLYYLTKAGIYDTRVIKEKSNIPYDYYPEFTEEPFDYGDEDYYFYGEPASLTREEYIKKMRPSPIKLEVEINGEVTVSYKKSGEELETNYFYPSGYLSGPRVNSETKSNKISPVVVNKSPQESYQKKLIEIYDSRAVEVITNLLDRVVTITDC